MSFTPQIEVVGEGSTYEECLEDARVVAESFFDGEVRAVGAEPAQYESVRMRNGLHGASVHRVTRFTMEFTFQRPLADTGGHPQTITPCWAQEEVACLSPDQCESVTGCVRIDDADEPEVEEALEERAPEVGDSVRIIAEPFYTSVVTGMPESLHADGYVLGASGRVLSIDADGDCQIKLSGRDLTDEFVHPDCLLVEWA